MRHCEDRKSYRQWRVRKQTPRGLYEEVQRHKLSTWHIAYKLGQQAQINSSKRPARKQHTSWTQQGWAVNNWQRGWWRQTKCRINTGNVVTHGDHNQRRRHLRTQKECKTKRLCVTNRRINKRRTRRSKNQRQAWKWSNGEEDPWNSCIQRRTCTEVKTAVKNNPPATISEIAAKKK